MKPYREGEQRVKRFEQVPKIPKNKPKLLVRDQNLDLAYMHQGPRVSNKKKKKKSHEKPSRSILLEIHNHVTGSKKTAV